MKHVQSEPPTVSIIIPVYNYATKVSRAIDSALAQTHPVDIIIVNDGSTDDSWAIINEYAQKHANITAINQENAGVAVARNKGISISNSKYIACLDADDALQPTFIESLVPTLESDRSLGIAYAGLWFILPDGREGKSPWPDDFDANQQPRIVPWCIQTTASRPIGFARLSQAPDFGGRRIQRQGSSHGGFRSRGQHIVEGSEILYGNS